MSNIVFDGVSRVFRRDGRDAVAVENLSFEVRDREFVAIVGPSGCGKTTCLRLAAGLDFPTSGSVKVGGKPVAEPGPQRAVVFQQFALFPWKTVHENIDFGLRSQGVPAEERRARIAAQLELMGLQGYESAFPHQLSGGMQQRASIARSFAVEPDVLLMDEPFSGLDEITARRLRKELLHIWSATQKTILFVTHNCYEAPFLADRILLMTSRPGRVYEEVAVDLPRPRDYDDPHLFAVNAGIVRNFLKTIGEE